MKRFFTIAWALVAAVAITACHNDTIDIPEIDSVPDGYMQISVPVAMPAMTEVATRGVDPDGMNIHKMSLFCFDKFGLFISYVDDVTLQATDATTGTVTKALVPDNTRRIHFVANQNMATFDDAAHRGMHEEQVMTELESSSGMMIYWGRYTDDDATSADEFKTTLNTTHGEGSSPIMLLRNQAMVTVSVESNVDFTLEGFTVVNTQAFGTVAPRHPELGFDFTIDQFNNTDFVTLPEDAAHQMKLTPPSDVDKAAATYVFETENTSDDPVSVIIKGKANPSAPSLYYRALVLVDEEYKMIRRNHHYKFEIVGPLSYGVETFDDAMETAPTNNVWLSIDDEVNEVRNGQYILGVEQTSVVVLAVPKDGGGYKYMYNGGELPNKQLSLNYTFSDINGAHVAEKPEVKWLNNDVATDWLNHEYASGRTDHFVEIQLKDISPNEEVQQTEGTILIQKGLLQRKIKVIVLKQQSFVPMWVTTQMYGGDTNTQQDGFQGSNVTLLFTVPEHTPDELLPFEVMISVDHLDVRAASGQPLPVIRSDDPRYGSDIRKHPNAAAGSAEASEVIGYKYVYTVTQKGDQRVYFHNILDQTDNEYNDHNHSNYVTVESPYFATLQKPFVFSTDDHQRVITISNLQTYSAAGSNDPVYYMLVPAKKGAHVKFDIRLMNGDTPIAGKYKSDPTDNTNPFDEFLLYSEYLDHDDHEISSTECYAHFTDPIEAGKYGTNARTFGMHFTKAPITVDDKDNVYPIKMHTNRANSAEVVRLASNQKGSPSVWPANGNGETYAGDGVDNFTYRSVIFELANYRPFRFMASVAGQGLADDDPSDGVDAVDHDAASGTVDGVSDVKWSYEPNQEIEVAFDITDFVANAQTVSSAEVDPFGRAFKVYIDAPMLEIDATKASTLMNADVTLPDDTTVKKFYKDTDGRFVYVVDANRATEAGYWSSTTTAHNTAANKKAGERKVLPFKTKSVVSTGEIRISADPDEVIYNEKVFNVSNKPITGSITFGDNETYQANVPAGEFVSFALVSDNSRIGSLTVTADGRYELRLRPEYQFNWGTVSDPDNSPNKVTIDYTVTDGSTATYYSATFNSLAALFGTPGSNGDSAAIKLVKQTQP